MSDIERVGQSYDAWFTAYPSTHARAGQTVEVVTREAFDGLADTHRGPVRALRALMEFGQKLCASESENERLIGACICEGARIVDDKRMSHDAL